MQAGGRFAGSEVGSVTRGDEVAKPEIELGAVEEGQRHGVLVLLGSIMTAESGARRHS